MTKNSEFALYSYDLSKEKKSKKVRFVYALKGRGDESGLIKKLNGRFIASACILIPIKKGQRDDANTKIMEYQI